MSLVNKVKGTLVDTTLTIGLILAVGGVYSVETRLPRRAVDRPKEGYQVKVERQTNLAGTTTKLTYTYSNRTRKDKPNFIAQFGGSAVTEGCVQDGLGWLVRHQAGDGYWSNACIGPARINYLSRCDDENGCAVPGQEYVMSQTGLALLALQAAGNYESNSERYSENVRRGLDWLVKHQRTDGAFVGPLSGGTGNYQRNYMYEHAMATFALAEACAVRRAQGEPNVESLWDAAVKATAFIEQQQHNDGGWRYSIRKQEASDCSVSGWAMLALKSAKEAEIPVGQETLDQTRDFFRSCETADGRTAYTPGADAGSDAITGVGMLTHLLLLKDPGAPLVKTSATHLAAQAGAYRDQIRGGTAEFYTLYNATLAMYLAGGDDWKTWNDAVRDAVVANQTQGPGCERGSWDPGGTNGGRQGGRIYSTALATLMLEVYYRFSREGQGTVSDAAH